jgi:hypothetical protein
MFVPIGDNGLMTHGWSIFPARRRQNFAVTPDRESPDEYQRQNHEGPAQWLHLSAPFELFFPERIPVF